MQSMFGVKASGICYGICAMVCLYYHLLNSKGLGNKAHLTKPSPHSVQADFCVASDE